VKTALCNLAAFALLGAQVQTKGTNAALTLEVHFITACDSGRASAPMQLAGSPNKYCLQASTIVDQRDVASAGFDQHAYDKPTIELILKDDAALRLRGVTGKSIGLQIGVVINGQLVSVAQIQDRVEQVWIQGLPRNTAESVVQVFQRGQAAKTAPPALPTGGTDSTQYDAQGVYRVGNGVSPPY
jgi:preprotein translocase subunit SecD